MWYFIFGRSLLLAICKWFNFKTKTVGLSKIFDHGESHLGCYYKIEYLLLHCVLYFLKLIGSILNPLAGTFSEGTRKKGKGAKTGASHDWRNFYLSQYDWLKGSHMTKVVWVPNETDYSYCEFVGPNTPYWPEITWIIL